MSRSGILLLLVLVILLGGIASLSFVNTEVQPQPVEKPIANAKLGL